MKARNEIKTRFLELIIHTPISHLLIFFFSPRRENIRLFFKGCRFASPLTKGLASSGEPFYLFPIKGFWICQLQNWMSLKRDIHSVSLSIMEVNLHYWRKILQ